MSKKQRIVVAILSLYTILHWALLSSGEGFIYYPHYTETLITEILIFTFIPWLLFFLYRFIQKGK